MLLNTHVRILGVPDTDEKGELDKLEETMCCLRLLKWECQGTVCKVYFRV